MGWRCCFSMRIVVSSSPTSFFNAALRRNRFTFQRHKIKKQNLPSPSEWSERFALESGDTSYSKTPKDTSTCFQIFTILQCNISSQHKTKSSPTAIAQATREIFFCFCDFFVYFIICIYWSLCILQGWACLDMSSFHDYQTVTSLAPAVDVTDN